MMDDVLYELKCCKWISIRPGVENYCPVCGDIFVVTRKEPENA